MVVLVHVLVLVVVVRVLLVMVFVLVVLVVLVLVIQVMFCIYTMVSGWFVVCDGLYLWNQMIIVMDYSIRYYWLLD